MRFLASIGLVVTNQGIIVTSDSEEMKEIKYEVTMKDGSTSGLKTSLLGGVRFSANLGVYKDPVILDIYSVGGSKMTWDLEDNFEDVSIPEFPER